MINIIHTIKNKLTKNVAIAADSNFSTFLRTATNEEREKVFAEAARGAIKDQQALLRKANQN